MTTKNPTLLLTGQCTGVRRELGRYTIDGIDRVLYGQRVNHSTIQITDKPAVLAHGHRSYLVDALDASDGYAAIQALVRDYLTQARRTRRIPAATVTDEWLTTSPTRSATTQIAPPRSSSTPRPTSRSR